MSEPEELDEMADMTDTPKICKTEEKDDKNPELEFERFVSEQKVFLFGRHIKFSMNFDCFFLNLDRSNSYSTI